MRLSYSQLEWFLRCPYIYKYQFIEGNTIPKGKDAAFGGLLHKVLEHIYSQRPLIPTLTEAFEFYEKQWDRKGISSYFPSELDARVHLQEGLRLIKDYYEHNDFQSQQVLAVEKFFEVPIKDSQSGETHLITGRIDRIDKAFNALEVIDYKTSKTLRSKDQIARDLQLSLYHLGLAVLWPDMVAKYDNQVVVSLYFLRHGEKVSVKKEPKELEDTKEKVLDYIRQIKEAIKKDSFEPRPSFLCAMEPYSYICPFFKDKHRKEKPKLKNQKEVSEVIHEYVALKEQAKQIKEKVAKLNELIHDYLDEQKLESIFDGDSGIMRSHSPLYDLDVQALKELLEPLGKWDYILDISKSKLKKITSELPRDLREKIEKARKIKGTSKSLRIKRL